jgi:hypothetical protein
MQQQQSAAQLQEHRGEQVSCHTMHVAVHLRSWGLVELTILPRRSCRRGSASGATPPAAAADSSWRR